MLKKFNRFYFVGVTGVGMAALAQVLKTMGKQVSGWDVANCFVTQAILAKQKIPVTVSASDQAELPDETEVVIYTGAHNGKQNRLVQEAIKRQLPIYTHAQALAELFNSKKGVAVCGVGGKSTTSAMLAFLTWKLKQKAAFQVGVGEIIGLNYTGFWSDEAEFFISEADEYAQNPLAVKQKREKLIPRFHYLRPYVTIVTNLQFDHPDVYHDFNQTQAVFYQFFQQIKPQGYLIYNQFDPQLVKLTDQLKQIRPDIQLIGFGRGETISLSLPGAHFRRDAAAAVAASEIIGLPRAKVLKTLKQFRSTGRRFEQKIKAKNFIGYDDYAHHPSEIKATISALRQTYPHHQLTIAFQPHTFSRTQALLNEFAQSLLAADRIVLLPIFTSAREKKGQVKIEDLAQKINQLAKDKPVEVMTINQLSDRIGSMQKSHTPQVLATLGAGDIYQAWETTPAIKLKNAFPRLDFKFNEPLGRHIHLGIGGPAEIFWEAKKQTELTKVIQFARKINLPLTILGWGSNVLIADQGLKGLVIQNRVSQISLVNEATSKKFLHQRDELKPSTRQDSRWQDWQKERQRSKESQNLALNKDVKSKPVYLRCAAGTVLALAINWSIAHGLLGLHHYIKIPGTIGGAIVNNIHGGEHLISELVAAVEIIDQTGKIKLLQPNQLEFAYDYSRFHHQAEIISQVYLKLHRGNQNQLKSAQEKMKQMLQVKQKQTFKSLGCVWQNLDQETQLKHNLPHPSVGYLLDKVLNLKNLAVNGARVSEKHAAFITVSAETKAADYLSLMKKIKRITNAKLGIKLKPEIFFLGFTNKTLATIMD